MFNLHKKRKNKGFTLIEILLVVGFIALAGIGIYMVYDKLQTSSKINKEINNLKVIDAGLKGLYASSTNARKYEGLSASIVTKAKIIPESMLSGSEDETNDVAVINSGLGGRITSIISAGSTSSFSPPSFASRYYIQYTGIPSDICYPFLIELSKNAFVITRGTALPLSPSGVVYYTQYLSVSLQNPSFNHTAAETVCTNGFFHVMLK